MLGPVPGARTGRGPELAARAEARTGGEPMSRRSFDDGAYHVDAGWLPASQAFVLWIQARESPALDPTVFADHFYDRPSRAVRTIAGTLEAFGITPPPTLFDDLRQDARLNRGDFDVHYDPETGTASIHAEYGDRPDHDALDFGVKSPERAAADGEEQEGLFPRDFGESSESSGRISSLIDRIRDWLHRDRDQGMGL